MTTPFDFDSPDVGLIKIYAKSSKKSTSASVSENTPDAETVAKVLNDIHNKAKSTEKQDTFICVGYLLQRGATSPKMQDTAYYEFNGNKVTKSLITNACRNFKITPRQLARALADQIADMAQEFGWPGNQAKNYRMDKPGASDTEIAFASDFQTFNPSCPPDVRDWLVKNFRDRFTP